jgi:acyl-CoA synthetase (NDP forming)
VASKTVHPAMKAVLKNVVSPERTEKLMETLAEMYEERGRQQGRTESLLRLLAARGIPVDAPSRQRILSCTDIATLDQWFDRAVNATQLSAVFGDLTQ